MYDSVTELSVLIPCGQSERDGVANFSPPKPVLKGGRPIRQDGGIMVRYSSVRALREDELRPGSKANLIQRLNREDQKRLLGLLSFRQAVENGDKLQLERLEKDYLQIVPDILAASSPEIKINEATKALIEAASARTFAQRHTQESAATLLAQILTKVLRHARLVLWWNDERFLPALYCPDLKTALYVRALLGIVGGKALLLCPRCGKPFFQQRSDQGYCSVRCREAHRVARWRANNTPKKRRAVKRR